jgi:60 kDa SS-A/Ro ribonucleoprotein
MPLTNKQWKQIAQNANWHSVRMNLNTFERHGVLKDSSVVKILADKLSDRETIKKVKVFPYQLMTAYLNIEANIPTELKNALQDAIEVACENVPVIDGQIYVFPDVSGSMSSGSVTGNRGSATSVVRPIDVAALISSIFLRQNKKTSVMPFDTRVHSTSALNSRDSIMTNAAKLRKFGGGGTSCEIVLQQLNQQKAKGDLLIYVSDNESWFGNRGYRHENTGVTQEWEVFKKRNPKAKMVCIDLVSNDTTQILDDKDVMNVGGFSDAVFEAIENFVNGKGKNKDWVSLIKATPLEKEE